MGPRSTLLLCCSALKISRGRAFELHRITQALELVDHRLGLPLESAFKSMKSDLAVRPSWHQLQPRVEAHLFVAFMGYCLMAALRKHLEPAAPGLSPRAVLQQLAAIQMVDVCLPTSDGRWLIMPRHTEPEAEQLMLLEKLSLTLPPQPPPRIRSGKLLLPEAKDAPPAP